MLPKWALTKAGSMNTNDLVSLVRKVPIPESMSGPVDRLLNRLQLGNLSKKQYLAIAAALVYLVTFWDVIPDIPVVGFVDDLAIIMSVLKQVER